MGMLRCPTCLTLLVGDEARCPACRSRLRKRSQPIVLGESNRIASRPQLNLDREVREAAEAKHAEARRRRRVAEATHRSAADTRPVTPRPVESKEVVAELVWAADPGPVPEPASPPTVDAAPRTQLFAEPEREPVAPAPLFARARPEPEPEAAVGSLLFTSISPPPERYPEFVPEPPSAPAAKPRGLFDLTWDDEREPRREENRPTPARSRRFIDLTSESEHALELVPEKSDAGADMHEMFEALHRKARAQNPQNPQAEGSVPDLEAHVIPPTSRALRLTAARSNRRRRWNVEFRGHRPDSGDT
jgi:hypothetical protein